MTEPDPDDAVERVVDLASLAALRLAAGESNRDDIAGLRSVIASTRAARAATARATAQTERPRGSDHPDTAGRTADHTAGHPSERPGDTTLNDLIEAVLDLADAVEAGNSVAAAKHALTARNIRDALVAGRGDAWR